MRRKAPLVRPAENREGLRARPATPTKIRAACQKLSWHVGGHTADKFDASLNAAIRKAFENKLPKDYDVDYSLDDVVSEALPVALKQFAEDVSIWPCKPKSKGDMGIMLVGLEGDFEMRFDLGEMLLDDVRSFENHDEALEQRAAWLERVAAKLRRVAIPVPPGHRIVPRGKT